MFCVTSNVNVPVDWPLVVVSEIQPVADDALHAQPSRVVTVTDADCAAAVRDGEGGSKVYVHSADGTTI